jgi:hypothetical protein
MVVSEDVIGLLCALLIDPANALLRRADVVAMLARLRRDGYVDDTGALLDPAAALVAVIAGAVVRIDARVVVGGVARELRAWGAAAGAVVGVVEGTDVRLSRVEREQLPGALAGALGLGPPGAFAAPPDRRPLAVPAPVLARLLDGGDVAVLHERGVVGRAAGAALALADQVRRAFTAVSAWRDADGELHTPRLSALEAGREGWWEIEPGEPDGRLVPTDTPALGGRIVGLLPG